MLRSTCWLWPCGGSEHTSSGATPDDTSQHWRPCCCKWCDNFHKLNPQATKLSFGPVLTISATTLQKAVAPITRSAPLSLDSPSVPQTHPINSDAHPSNLTLYSNIDASKSSCIILHITYKSDFFGMLHIQRPTSYMLLSSEKVTNFTNHMTRYTYLMHLFW